MRPGSKVVLVLAFLTATPAQGTDIGLCAKLPFELGEGRSVLEGSQIGSKAEFIGTFRIENISRKSDLTVEGRLIDGVLRLEHPRRMVEYADIYDIWQRTLELVKDPGPRSDRIVIRPGSRLFFRPR